MKADVADHGLAALQADHEFFAKTGPLPLRWSDVRRFPRFYLRGQAIACIQAPRDTSPSRGVRVEVLTSDVSRGGLGMICSEQLFPEQRLQVQMAAGSNYELKVVWCRRLGPSRYAAGCVFIETPPAASEL